MDRKNINTADNAVKGVSDIIQGVKTDIVGDPENRRISERHDACDADKSKGVSGPEYTADSESAAGDTGHEAPSPATAQLSSPVSDIGDGESPEEEKALDAEFEALIKGRYRNAYRRRTENIVRRRLKGVKNSGGGVPRGNTEDPADAGDPALTEAAAELPDEAPKKNNIVRPAENGVGGSVGVYTRINVSALTGRDVREMIERAASGETITFM